MATATRLHGLDALRGGALLLGILYHAGFSFFPGTGFWFIMDVHRSDILSAGAFTLHMFRMTVFFILAGYFGHMQTYRLGTRAFMKDRLKRLGIPLVVFLPVMVALFIALAIWAMIVNNGGVMPENPPPPPPLTIETFPLTHLWFLYVLLIFYGAMILARAAISVLASTGALPGFAGAVLRTFGKSPLLPVLLALPTAVVLAGYEPWYPYFGIPAPDYGLIPNSPSLVAYGTAFVFGWILHRQSGLIERVSRNWLLYLFTAIGMTAVCLTIVGTTVELNPFPAGRDKMIVAALYASAIWYWAIGFIGLANQCFSAESKTRRYLADASYWLYIIHLPIVVALQIWVSQWPLAAELKYILILVISVPLMLTSYHLLVRFTFMGALLNGRKRQRSGRKEPLEVT